MYRSPGGAVRGGSREYRRALIPYIKTLRKRKDLDLYNPKITIENETDICVYFCFMLSELGELCDSTINEIILSVDSVNYFELISSIGFMEEKSLITIKKGENNENIYSLTPDGEKLAKAFYMHIPLSVREKTVKTGKDIIERLEREKAIRCFIDYDNAKKRYDLIVRFINEINGEPILEMKLFAPDEKTAQEMKERFLKDPPHIIKRTMNMFLKDDYFLYDD